MSHGRLVEQVLKLSKSINLMQKRTKSQLLQAFGEAKSSYCSTKPETKNRHCKGMRIVDDLRANDVLLGRGTGPNGRDPLSIDARSPCSNVLLTKYSYPSLCHV